MGVNLFEDDNSRDLLVIFLELRNIYVHNRAYINDLFLKRVRNDFGLSFIKNGRYHADFPTQTLLINNCMNVATRLDGIMAEKFRLERRRHAVWKDKPPRFV